MPNRRDLLGLVLLAVLGGTLIGGGWARSAAAALPQ